MNKKGMNKYMQKLKGFCLNFNRIFDTLFEQNVAFEIYQNELIFRSRKVEQKNIEFVMENFFCINLEEVNLESSVNIKFYNLDICKIIEQGKCDESFQIPASHLGNGMIIKKSKTSYFIVTNHNYSKNKVELIAFENEEVGESIRKHEVNRSDVILCEDVQFKNSTVNMSKKIIIENEEETFVFCGYMQEEKYNQIVSIDKHLIKNGRIHDFIRFKKQNMLKEDLTTTTNHSCSVFAQELGNGRIIKSKTVNKFYVVINNNYSENEIHLASITFNKTTSNVRIFDIDEEDVILCDDIELDTAKAKINMSKKVIIKKDDKCYLFYGYITVEKYRQITAVNRCAILDKNNRMQHEFIENQK